MKMVFAAILLLSLCQPVWAESHENDLPAVADLFAAPCLELGLPCPLTMAIAKVESNFHPWSLNIEGRSYRFKNKGEALAKARAALTAGRSFDVGLMQVNSWWLKKYGIALEAALDPLANIYLGCWILKYEIDRHKNLRAAVGAYHSPNPEKASRYADVVMAALERGPVKASVKAAPKPKISTVSIPKPGLKRAAPDNRRMVINRDQTPRYSFSTPSSTMKVRSKSK